MIELDPRNTAAYRQLSNLITHEAGNKYLSGMLALKEDPTLEPNDQCHLDFGLAKAYDDLKRYEKAFQHYVNGNALRKETLHYNIKIDIKQFKSLMAASRLILEKAPPSQGETLTTTPIFVIGMPRSGTTLVEQIITAHPKVFGGGELPFVAKYGLDLATGKTPITTTAITNFRKEYLESIKPFANGSSYITDKMPHNFRFVPLLIAAIPEAKIIHVSRSSRATCWSNFKVYFNNTGLGYLYDLDDLVHYYQLYKNLMGYWTQLFPNRLIDCNYDQLTMNQEPSTRSLIAYLSLDWRNECLFPENNTRSVDTASFLQVRQKLYKGSSQDWKKYERYLDGKFDSLPD